MADWVIQLLLISAAGGLGAVLRSVITSYSGWLPWGLILTNSLAAALVGWWLAGPTLTKDYLLVITVGFTGGLSTYSTVAKEVFDFYHRGRIFQSTLTFFGNVFVPLGALMLATSMR
jgi:fluoride ion exporter CrcB/FEX